MFQLNKPATFKQNATTDSSKLSQPAPLPKRPPIQPMFAKKRVVTQLPVAMDTESSTSNPYKYVADTTSQSEKSAVANSNTTPSSPPAVFDVNQLFRSSTSNESVSDVLSCEMTSSITFY